MPEVRVACGLSQVLLTTAQWGRCSIVPILKLKLRSREGMCPAWGPFLVFTPMMLSCPCRSIWPFQGFANRIFFPRDQRQGVSHSCFSLSKQWNWIRAWLPLELQCQATSQALPCKRLLLLSPLCPWTLTGQLHLSLLLGLCLEKRQVAGSFSLLKQPVLCLPWWQSRADPVSWRIKTSLKFEPWGPSSLSASLSANVLSSGRLLSTSWPSLSQEVILQK